MTNATAHDLTYKLQTTHDRDKLLDLTNELSDLALNPTDHRLSEQDVAEIASDLGDVLCKQDIHEEGEFDDVFTNIYFVLGDIVPELKHPLFYDSIETCQFYFAQRFAPKLAGFNCDSDEIACEKAAAMAKVLPVLSQEKRYPLAVTLLALLETNSFSLRQASCEAFEKILPVLTDKEQGGLKELIAQRGGVFNANNKTLSIEPPTTGYSYKFLSKLVPQ